MDRDDFFELVPTCEPEQTVNVSAGDIFKGQECIQTCLVQVGVEGDYACAYLDDEQVRKLIGALRSYLEAEPN